jgi:hypothetical protein
MPVNAATARRMAATAINACMLECLLCCFFAHLSVVAALYAVHVCGCHGIEQALINVTSRNHVQQRFLLLLLLLLLGVQQLCCKGVSKEPIRQAALCCSGSCYAAADFDWPPYARFTAAAAAAAINLLLLSLLQQEFKSGGHVAAGTSKWRWCDFKGAAGACAAAAAAVP